jgi:hypothetical protein
MFMKTDIPKTSFLLCIASMIEECLRDSYIDIDSRVLVQLQPYAI